MRAARIAAMALLAFLGITALAGALPMLLHPRGSTMVPLSLLEHTPFHSYMIPGIVLLTANGLLALGVLWLVWVRRTNYGMWVAAQGCVLLGWLIVLVWMLRVVVWLNYFYGAIAVALIAVGFALWRGLRQG